MGPYCNYCNQRCFTHMPAHTPPHIFEAYVRAVGGVPILATCPSGKAMEKERVGYCIDDIPEPTPEEQALDDEEDEVCAALLANDHAVNVAVARLLPVLLGEEEQDPERWDGLS